ncbi:MAG: CBS domain-containing protein [Candidatus Aenigmarchaeota archaeon]|nr:CBS domain-containing protein [Candidatus Aenigmarchaeota archaeon]
MLVGDVMNKNVKTIEPNATIKDAVIKMSKYRIGSLVVVSNNNVIGIITERDIISDVVAEEANLNNIKVEDIMTRDLIAITSSTTLEEAAKIMTDNKIKKLPVIDNGKLVGIITASDLIAYEEKLIEQLASLLVTSPPPGRIGG